MKFEFNILAQTVVSEEMIKNVDGRMDSGELKTQNIGSNSFFLGYLPVDADRPLSQELDRRHCTAFSSPRNRFPEILVQI